MPVIPIAAPAPYDSVIVPINEARVRLNDEITTLQPVSGKLLTNNQVFTQASVNTAWRRLQEYLANLGYEMFRQEDIIFSIPPTTNIDPGIQVWLNWFNYFDGNNLFNSPVLPQDLMFPMRLWERQSGSQAAFCPMEMIEDGLPSWNKQTYNAIWEWRADAIYMPGALMTTDIRVRYSRYLADFLDITSPATPWFQLPVPLMRSSDALSYFICAELADSVKLDPAAFRVKGETAAKLIMNRDMATKQRVNVRRRSRSGRLEGYGNSDYGMCY